jgi:thiol-disulfide isomerase/thioredoxin
MIIKGIRLSVISVLFVCTILAACNKGTPVSMGSSAEAVVGLGIGNLAPELSLPSPEGKTISLSGYRGKIVLIDFWAAWCMPCRIENPNLVKVYERFKNKKFTSGNGFTIYSISLDHKPDQWMEAIAKDGLSWDAHVSDLKGWKSVPAAMYQVSSIPANVLINGDGIIIAKNLRAEALEKTMEALLK